MGAPYIADIRLAKALNEEGIPGARFVPVRFTPNDDIFKNQSCGGVNIILTDRDKCRVIDIGMAIAKILNRWYPEQFEVKKMSRLLVDDATVEALEADKPLAAIRAMWEERLKGFEGRREKYLLYR